MEKFIILTLIIMKSLQINAWCFMQSSTNGKEYYEECLDFFGCFKNVRELYKFNTIICENETNLTAPLKILHPHILDARILKFSNSNLPLIAAGVFTSLGHIEIIYLNNSYIEIVEPGSLNVLINIREIYLQDNIIEHIDKGTFSGLAKLSFIDLSNNKLTIVDRFMFKQINNLQILNISGNEINFIDNLAFDTCRNLIEIDLSCNNITELSGEIFKSLFKLDTLGLTDNHIHYIDENLLNSLTNLAYLNLKDNCIDIVNFTNENSKLYYELNIAIIQKSPPLVQKTISILDLAHNQINELLPNGFEKFKSLQILYLSNNGIENVSVSAFKGLDELNVLELMNNNIKKLDIGTFQFLRKLISLNLSTNLIEEIDYGLFSGISQLRTLDLSANRIKTLEIRTLYPLRNLNYLNIDNNFISIFNPTKIIKHIPTLVRISLNNNKWTCDWLTNAINILKRFNITILDGTNYQTYNVHGNACLKVKNISTSSEIIIYNLTKMVELSKMNDLPKELSNKFVEVSKLPDKLLIDLDKFDKTTQQLDLELINMNEIKSENDSYYDKVKFQKGNEIVDEDGSEIMSQIHLLIVFVAIVVTLLITLQALKLYQSNYFKNFLFTQKQ